MPLCPTRSHRNKLEDVKYIKVNLACSKQISSVCQKQKRLACNKLFSNIFSRLSRKHWWLGYLAIRMKLACFSEA